MNQTAGASNNVRCPPGKGHKLESEISITAGDSSSLEIDRQQTDGVKLEFAEENVAKEKAELSVHSPANLQNTDVSHEGKVSSLPESEKSQDREEQVQGLGSLDTLEQQLRETEVHCGAEIPCLQGRLQTIHEVTVQPSLCIDSVVFKESETQETVDHGNCLNEHVASTTEFPGGFEGRKETNMAKLMEKHYQERLEEEIAKIFRQFEDIRQERVWQWEEDQQAIALLRQAHMQWMERQREDQEQLQEIQRLIMQLAQKSSIRTENVSERERVLLEELKVLKQLCSAGRGELCCELHHSSTQTQDENDNQEVEEQTLKEQTSERKPEHATLDVNLPNER